MNTKIKFQITTASLCGLLVSAVSVGQPNQGDLSVYEGGIGSTTESSETIQPNLIFIADTSGSMDWYVPVEYSQVKDSYDPNVDYGADGSALDDDYIYVYDDIESFSGVTITPDQNKCDAINTTYSNSPEFPLFTGKALQWKPSEGEVVISEGVVCEITSVSPTTLAINNQTAGNNWTKLVTVPSALIYNDDVISGSSISMTISNTGNRDADGGIYYFGTDASGNYNGTGGWLCTRNTWDRNGTETCTGNIDDIPEDFYELTFWLNTRGGSTSVNGEIIYNLNVGDTQTDPSCVASDPVTSDQVVDGEWSGNLETNDDSAYILECEADAGVHGFSGSTDPFVQFCGTAECISPRYVSSGGIDWNSEGLSDMYFYSGNYHDYLNFNPSVPDVVFDIRQRWEFYDNEGGVNDWDVVDYGGNPNRNVESFCDILDNNQRIASDRNDPSTYVEYGHPLVAPFYIEDSEDGFNFIYECQRKNDIMRNALTDMITSMSEVNMGLMRFNGGNGGYVLSDVANVDEGTNRADLIATVDALPAAGSTPLAETLYESYLYLSGKDEVYSTNNADPAAFISGNTNKPYESPITHSCQSNNIIYLTDGEPTSDGGSYGLIEALPGVANCNTGGNDDFANQSCLDDLAEFMATNDVSDNIDGENTVTTYTIGFNIDLDLLEEVAQKGGGEYYTAVSYNDLIDSFQDILLNIALSEPSTLVAPAVSVNAFNELQHRDQIYYATFTPTFDPAWQGNVKRYGITSDAIIYGQAGPSVSAIGDDGFFRSSAQSFWSDFPDGPRVEEGGYREQLTNSRNLYVDGSSLDTSTTGIVLLDTTQSFDPDQLENSFSSETSNVDAAEADEIRDWLLGIDVDDINDDTDNTDAHRYAADSLHSRPFVITYSGTNEANAEDILFLTTNLGLVTAVDASNGEELWSYLPGEFVDNLKTYKDNPSSLRHWNVYGLDGEATIWAEEAVNSTSTNFEIGDVYMYQGMRRGGRNYYAWDISDANSTTNTPISNLWASPIIGGEGDFVDLGFTWSKMVRTKIRWNCTNNFTNAGCDERDVLVFSGGYDAAYDGDANKVFDTDSVNGDAVYVVDALTGEHIWSAGNNPSHTLVQGMYNSIPGDPSPIDIDGDGDMDMLFVVDIAGKVFRFDFDQTHTSNNSAGYATGGQIADLNSGGDTRRFYNGLDVALQAPELGDTFLTISVGSGYRAGPKLPESWANRFYVIVDENVSGPQEIEGNVSYEYVGNDASNRSIITQADLFAFSGEAFVLGEDGDYGFYRSFSESDSEKVLQSSVTFDGDIIVATYTPVGNEGTGEECGTGDIGGGRIYKFNALTGESTLFVNSVDADGDGYPDSAEEFIETGRGIPTDPAILLLPGEIVTCFGTDCYDDLIDFDVGTATKTYWQEQTQ